MALASSQKTLEPPVIRVIASSRTLGTDAIRAHLDGIGCTCKPVVTLSRTALLADHSADCPAHPDHPHKLPRKTVESPTTGGKPEQST